MTARQDHPAVSAGLLIAVDTRLERALPENGIAPVLEPAALAESQQLSDILYENDGDT